MYEYRAEIMGVYDGDTIRVDIDLGFGSWLCKQTLRLYGVNTPELRGPGKREGLYARDYVRSLLGVEDDGSRWGRGTEVHVLLRTQKDKKGKFGRWLATVEFLDDPMTLNEILIKKGYECPSDWL